MVYMCGSNLESDGAKASNDISSMLAARANMEDVNVVLLLGGTTVWSTGYDASVLTLLQLGTRRPSIVTTFPLTGMNESVTMSNFLTYCYENYPADRYDLMIWDHGGGPISGVCQDSLFKGDTLQLKELTDALDASPFANGGLELVSFNACLMSSAEVGVALAPYANYMVASEDTQYGLDFAWLSGIENDADGLETGKKIVDSSFASNVEIRDRQSDSML